MSPSANIEQSRTLDWSRISVQGPQGEIFLQGQLTQDLETIADRGRWSLLLHPDSAVLATCFVQRDGDGFTLTVPRSLGEAALSRLRRFHLRIACTLTLEEVASGPYATTDELVAARWPGANECGAQLSPRSYGSDVVAATVSFTKGCYTGQELVGRLDARGSSVPWRFVWASGPSVARINEVLAKGPAGPRGVTTAVVGDNTVEALGFAHRSLLINEPSAVFGDVSVEAIG